LAHGSSAALNHHCCQNQSQVSDQQTQIITIITK